MVVWCLVACGLVLLADRVPARAAWNECFEQVRGVVRCEEPSSRLTFDRGRQSGWLLDERGHPEGWYRVNRDGSVELFDRNSSRIGTVPRSR